MMFTATLDVLFFFMISTAVVGWLSSKIRVKNLVQYYSVIGFVSTILFFLVYDLPLVSANGFIIVKTIAPTLGTLLEVDSVSIFMISIYLLLGLFVVIYSVRYMENETGLPQYYVLIFGMIAGMVGVVSAGDFFTLFIFWELMSITSYVLVAFRKTQKTAMEASFKYLIISSFGAGTILFALSLLYGATGTLNLASLSQSLLNAAPTPWLMIVFAMITVGFGIKTAIVPLHTWLPDAHSEAPSSISALLSGVLIETGLYGFCRIFIIMFSLQFRWDILIAVLAIVTMTTGNIMALLQKDLKRLLAYSSISQIGYMLIGLAVAGTPGSSQANIDGLTGLFMHVFNHSLMKGLAFLSAGALIYKLGSRELTNLKGVGRLMPVTSVSLSISLLALGGVPSFSGFISKYTLFLSAFEGGMPVLAIAGILNSGLSMAYYLRVIQTIFLAKPEKDISRIKEVPPSMLMVLIAMAALITIFGLWPGPLFEFSQNAAGSLLQIGEYVRRIIPL